MILGQRLWFGKSFKQGLRKSDPWFDLGQRPMIRKIFQTKDTKFGPLV